MLPDDYHQKRLSLKKHVDAWQTIAEREAYAGRNSLKMRQAALEEYYARERYYQFLAEAHKKDHQ